MRRLLPGPAAVLALLVTLPIALSPLKNYDLFFHLAGGRWLLAHGFTRQDPFSVTGTAGWVPHEWGFGILAELSLRVFGAAGPELLVATLIAAFVLLAWRAIRIASPSPGLVELAVLCLTLVSQAFTWYQERPYHLGHVLFALAVLLTLAWRRGSQVAPWLLVPLCALWANLHGSWILGPALLGSTAVGAWLDGGDAAHRRRCVQALGAAVLAYLASALSPSGPSIYLYPILHSRLASTLTLEEWQPLDLTLIFARYYLAFAFLAAFVCGGARPRAWAILLPTLGPHGGLARCAAARAVRRAAPGRLRRGAPLAHGPLLAPRGRPRRLEPAERLGLGVAAAGGRRLLALRGARGDGCLRRAAPGHRARAPLPGPLPAGLLRHAEDAAAGQGAQPLHHGRRRSPTSRGPSTRSSSTAGMIPSRQEIHDDYDKFVYGLPGWREALARYSPDYVLWNRTGPGSVLPDALQREGGWAKVLEPEGEDCILLRREHP